MSIGRPTPRSATKDGMNLTGVESYTQKVVLGLVLLRAVLLDMLKKRGQGSYTGLPGFHDQMPVLVSPAVRFLSLFVPLGPGAVRGTILIVAFPYLFPVGAPTG